MIHMTRHRLLVAILVLGGLLVSGLCHAKYSDRQLTEAYLTEDMALWDSYLQDTPWEQADNKERARILLYEYGYIPYLFSVGDTATCSRHYDRYIQHIEQHKEQLPHAAYCAYRSAGHAYAHMLKKGGMMDAIRSLRLAQEAVKSDSLQPLVLYNRGNVYYHAPSFVGGSKRKALE